MIRLRILVFIMYFVGFTINAQSIQRASLGNSGDSFKITNTKGTFYVSQSVGQSSVIGTFSNKNYTIQQGFQHSSIVVEIIPELTNDLNAIIYPNPIDNLVTIKLSELLKTSVDFTVYDILGKVIYHESRNPKKIFTLDLSFLVTGTYLLHLTSESKRFSARLIKK